MSSSAQSTPYVPFTLRCRIPLKRALCCAALLLAQDAVAASDLAIDRRLAEGPLPPQQYQRCLEDFSKRLSRRPMELSGQFRFNERISRDVYDMLYWKEGGHGVAFTAPVKILDPERGEVATNIACFYAVKDNELVFQHAQQVAWRF